VNDTGSGLGFGETRTVIVRRPAAGVDARLGATASGRGADGGSPAQPTTTRRRSGRASRRARDMETSGTKVGTAGRSLSDRHRAASPDIDPRRRPARRRHTASEIDAKL